jgi:hypothetical protein
VQNLPQSQSNPQPATKPPAQASAVNLAAAKPAVATTGAAVNAVVKPVAAKAVMSAVQIPRTTPPAQTALKALADEVEVIAPTDAVAKKLPRQKMQTLLFQQRLWYQAQKRPNAPRVKKPKAAVVVVDAASAQAKPLQMHKCL